MATHTHEFYQCTYDMVQGTLLYSITGDSESDASGEIYVTSGFYSSPEFDYDAMFTDNAECYICHVASHVDDEGCEYTSEPELRVSPYKLSCNGLDLECDGECVVCIPESE